MTLRNLFFFYSIKLGGRWRVKVRTSDMPSAECRAQVFLTLLGTKDMSKPTPLGSGTLNSAMFDQGKETEFDLTVGKIGELTKIRLELDSKFNNPSWHVDWVGSFYIVGSLYSFIDLHVPYTVIL